MEFPNLGEHCGVSTCSQLDFLPIKCDACQAIFCGDHVTYQSHSCPSSYKKNVQVPVCPLCQKPVPVGRGELPDVKMGEHMDKDCKSDSKPRIYTNHCHHTGCKQRELIPISCSICGLNFCLKHRHQVDHDCVGRLVAPGKAAQTRAAANKNTHSVGREPLVVNGLIEDEALARALQNSLAPTDLGAASSKVMEPVPTMSQEAADEALAKALAQSEAEYLASGGQGTSNRQQPSTPKDKSCAVS